jgi:hypothetical protein
MKLPLIQKIEIDQFDKEFLETTVKKNRCGSIPTLLIIHPEAGQPLEQAYRKIQEAFVLLNVNPRFPYPTYVLRDGGVEQDFFPEVESKEEIPKHFIKKIKRMKKREQTLHGKTVTFSDRISNHPLTRDLDYMEQKSNLNRVLRDSYMEKRFYLDLLQKIKGNNKEEEKV